MNKKLSLITLLSIGLLSGCMSENEAAAPAPVATAIDVAKVAVENVQAWHTYTTRLESPEVVTLMPRVSGIVEQVAFTEGQSVSEGDLLFQIDPRPFQAQVARLKAQIKSAEAALEQAIKSEKRAVNLGKTSAIAVEQIETRVANTKQRRADLLALHAELEAAQLNLSFTRITSPIDGLISRAEITKGNNVNANQSVLTNIISTEQMYAYFNIDERTWNGQFHDVTAQDQLPVILELTGNNDQKYGGYVDFIDNTVNPSTGTLRVRATFNTHDNSLRAGSFARLKLAANDSQVKVLVPERAIGTDLKNQFVLTVTPDNVLEYRQVKVGARFGKFRAIDSGLKANDVIAVNGPAKVGPGMTISPRNVTLDLSKVALNPNKAGAITTVASAD
ncbi:MAG: efflux RND transporter periplasmic adaptor subunit [Psychrobium sp.]